MPLEEYVAKRRFSETPEPAPGKLETGGNYFCVQRHDATRLHYDFRLEIDGVLKSWAVPKGPSLDPTLKHLAAFVEDHPVEYGSFEGNIPAGNYGGGSVMLWDRGAFELLGGVEGDAQIARGDLKFRLHGEKLNGDFALVHMKGRGKSKDWLIIKKRDEFAQEGWDIEDHAWSVLSGRTQQEIAQNLPAKKSKRKTAGASDRVWASSKPAARKSAPAAKTEPVKSAAKRRTRIDLDSLKGARKAEMPESIEPMSAMIGEHPPKSDGWLFEVKWDGVRAIAFLDNETVRLQSRTGNRCERQYPELAVIHHQVAASSAVLDGEIAVLDAKGVSQFHLIQPRIANTDPNSISHLARSTPVVYFVFDLLYLDGYDLRGVALAKRRELLEQVVSPGGNLRISEAFQGGGEEMLEAARQTGLEGILAKHGSSLYESKRSREWLKLKIVTEQEFVIGGFTEPQGDRSHFGALVLGIYDDDKLQWVGNVGTGFDHKMLDFLADKLKPLITDKCPFEEKPNPSRGMTWVKPALTCQVKFTHWTQDSRLRAPVYLGLRNDVASPKEVHREQINLLPPDAKELTFDIDKRSLKFTNLPKVYYPKNGYTKRDVINYYDRVADLILPHLKDRPLSLKRYPNGINQDFFFQKNTPENYPSWLRTEAIDSEHNGSPINYVFADDRASLLYLVNLGCIDHNPWMSRSGSLDNPDFILIDLDPQQCSFDLIVEAALMVKLVLDQVGLRGYPKTTGGDGMHVYIPVEPEYTYEMTRTFADAISRIVTMRKPSLFTTPRSVAKREKNRVYFDYLQNGNGKTIAAPYVLHAHTTGAPVATPARLERGAPRHRPAAIQHRQLTRPLP